MPRFVYWLVLVAGLVGLKPALVHDSAAHQPVIASTPPTPVVAVAPITPAVAAPAVAGRSGGSGPQPVAVALQKRAAGTFYISGAIEGHGDVELLVDTGSSFLVINESILAGLQKSGHAQFSHELKGSMADGSQRVVPVYRLSALRLGEACWVRDVEAAVFPGASRTILGMNVLSRLAPFTFSASPPELALHRCQSPMATEEIEDEPGSGAVGISAAFTP